MMMIVRKNESGRLGVGASSFFPFDDALRHRQWINQRSNADADNKTITYLPNSHLKRYCVLSLSLSWQPAQPANNGPQTTTREKNLHSINQKSILLSWRTTTTTTAATTTSAITKMDKGTLSWDSSYLLVNLRY